MLLGKLQLKRHKQINLYFECILKLFKIKRGVEHLFCKKKKKRKIWNTGSGRTCAAVQTCACAMSARGLRDVTSNSVRSVVAGDFRVLFCRSSSFSEEKHSRVKCGTKVCGVLMIRV